MVIDLREVVDTVESMPFDWTVWLVRDTGELITLSENEPDPDDEERVEALDEQGQLLELPTVRDIPEGRVVERFIASLDDDGVADRLDRAFQGSGRWRAFKDELARLGLRDAYGDYRWEAVRQEIEEVLRAEGIEYE